MPAKGEFTRERILGTARHLFRTRGFHAVSISDLVDAVGLRKGSLYFHFSGKEDLARAVFAEASAEFLTILDRTLDGENPGQALERFFHRLLDTHLAAGFVGGCLFGNTAVEMSDANPQFAQQVADLFDAWTARLAAVVDRAQEKGQIRKDLPARMLAQQIVATL